MGWRRETSKTSRAVELEDRNWCSLVYTLVLTIICRSNPKRSVSVTWNDITAYNYIKRWEKDTHSFGSLLNRRHNIINEECTWSVVVGKCWECEIHCWPTFDVTAFQCVANGRVIPETWLIENIKTIATICKIHIVKGKSQVVMHK